MSTDASRLWSAVARRLGPHGRRAAILLSGALVAQVVPIAASPILTRLYSAAEYGLLAIFGSLTAIIVAVASGRYHMAITLPQEDEEAVKITTLAIAVAVGLCATLLLAAVVWYLCLPVPNAVAALGAWLILVPVAALLGSIYDSLSYLSLRLDELRSIARAGGGKAIAGAAVQIGLGFMGLGSAGILTGNLVSLLAGNMTLARRYLSMTDSRKTPWSELRRLAGQYRDFAKFDVWANLANVVSANILVLGMTGLFGPTTVGHYALAFRLLTLPAMIVGSTVGQVYLREISLRVRNPVAARRAFDKTLARLAAISLPPFIALAFVAGDLFAFVFGAEWREAGSLAAAMIPLVWVRFLVSPLSTTFLVYERQRQLLLWQIGLLVATGTCFLGAALDGWSAVGFLRIFSWVLLPVYVLLLAHARAIIGRGVDAREEPLNGPGGVK